MDTQKPTPKTKGCRVCGENTRGGGRGLCQKHYRRWKAKYDELAADSQEAAEQYEQDLIRDGWIKPFSRGGRPKADEDPFDSYAENAVSLTGIKGVQRGSSPELEEDDLVSQDEATDIQKRAAFPKKRARKSADVPSKTSDQTRKRKSG